MNAAVTQSSKKSEKKTKKVKCIYMCCECVKPLSFQLKTGRKGFVRELLSFPYTNECQSAHEVHKGNKA